MPTPLFVDSHCHVFSLRHIPKTPALRDNMPAILQVLTALADLNLVPGATFRAFLGDGNRSTAQIANDLLSCYAQAHQGLGLSHALVPLMVDFGHAEHDGDALFAQQLADVLALKAQRPNEVWPFLAMDPRRERLAVAVSAGGVNIPAGTPMLEVAKTLTGTGKPFAGIKLYPSMGFFPHDARLKPLFAHCVANSLPVTAHCGNDGGLAPLLVAALNLEGLNPVQLIDIVTTSQRYCSPYYWEPVLQELPALTLNLAHFGGTSELRRCANALLAGRPELAAQTWTGQILALLRGNRYPNLYTDLSACLVTDRATATIVRDVLEPRGNVPMLAQRLLYGSDYYMTSANVPRPELTQRVARLFTLPTGPRGFFDPTATQLLTAANPRRFL